MLRHSGTSAQCANADAAEAAAGYSIELLPGRLFARSDNGHAREVPFEIDHDEGRILLHGGIEPLNITAALACIYRAIPHDCRRPSLDCVTTLILHARKPALRRRIEPRDVVG